MLVTWGLIRSNSPSMGVIISSIVLVLPAVGCSNAFYLDWIGGTKHDETPSLQKDHHQRNRKRRPKEKVYPATPPTLITLLGFSYIFLGCQMLRSSLFPPPPARLFFTATLSLSPCLCTLFKAQILMFTSE